MHLSAVIYDFDYTLVDSSVGVVKSISYALTRGGFPVPSPEQIKQTIGLSLPGAFDQLIDQELTEEQIDALVTNFIVRADEVMAPGTKLFPGVKEAILAFHEAGIHQGVVSNKLRRRIVEVLKRDGIDHCFSVIVGAGDVPAHKPDPTALLKAVECIGCSRDSVVYVGDHLVDAQAATAAELPFVAVLTGFTSREQFQAYKPLAIIDSAARLPEVLGSGAAESRALA